MSPHERAFRALLRLLPAPFRHAYGHEMTELFLGRVTRARARRGARGVVALWGRTVWDVVRTAVAERRGGGSAGPGRRAASAVDALGRDLRLAVRSLLRRPLFAAVAILSLAMGVGATTALFSAVDVLLLRPLPGVGGWERAVELGRGSRGHGFDTFSWPDFVDLRERVPALEEVAGWRPATFSLATAGGGLPVPGAFVTAEYFAALGVALRAGRAFTGAEDRPGSPGRVAVVSDHFWRTRMGADADAVGATLHLDRVRLTVVGITAPGFRGHVVGMPRDVFVPLALAPTLHEVQEDIFARRGSSWLMAVGRLASDATVEGASAQVEALFRRLQADHPDTNRDVTARAMALGPVPGGGRGAVAGFLGALLALVAVVLLATCVNVAGMFLARAASREREIAVRLAVGVGRGRLARQLLMEALAVFALGGAGGAAVAWWAMGLADLGALPVPVEISLDLRPEAGVLAAALGIALAAGLLFGMVPALQAGRTDVAAALRGDGGGGGGSSRLRRAFAAGQVGLSLVLLVAAGLFLRALQEAGRVHTGFDPRGAWTTALDLSREDYGPDEGAALEARMVERLEALPGVEAAALGIDLPLDLSSHGTGILPEGWAAEPGREYLGVDFNHVSPGWFRTLGIPLFRGRGFDEADVAGAEEVAVVSRVLAERAWPGQDPLGRHFEYPVGSGRTVTVVGVADDALDQTLMEAPDPFVYRPLAQAYRPDIQAVVRTSRPGTEVAPAVRAALLELDPGLAVGPVQSVARITSVGVLPQRIGASVAGILGAVALLLSGLGVYGVVAFGVARRTREIGVRMALGSGTGRVLRHVLAGGLRLALPGLAAGALLAGPLAWGLARLNVLLGVAPWDPAALAAVAAALLGVVLLASLVPARRAARIEPSDALRSE